MSNELRQLLDPMTEIKHSFCDMRIEFDPKMAKNYPPQKEKHPFQLIFPNKYVDTWVTTEGREDTYKEVWTLTTELNDRQIQIVSEELLFEAILRAGEESSAITSLGEIESFLEYHLTDFLERNSEEPAGSFFEWLSEILDLYSYRMDLIKHPAILRAKDWVANHQKRQNNSMKLSHKQQMLVLHFLLGLETKPDQNQNYARVIGPLLQKNIEDTRKFLGLLDPHTANKQDIRKNCFTIKNLTVVKDLFLGANLGEFAIKTQEVIEQIEYLNGQK